MGTGDVEIVVAVVALFFFSLPAFAVLTELRIRSPRKTHSPGQLKLNSSTGSVTVSLCVFDSSLSTQFKLAE